MSDALRAAFTNDVIRAICALARQQNVCREQAGQVVFVTGMEASREYIVEQIMAVTTPAVIAEWQPMETAPRDGTPFIVCWPASKMGSSHADPVSGWREYQEILDLGSPPALGWFKMPPLPKKPVASLLVADGQLVPRPEAPSPASTPVSPAQACEKGMKLETPLGHLASCKAVQSGWNAAQQRWNGPCSCGAEPLTASPGITEKDRERAAKAVEKYAEWCGGVHDEGCPEDDTCSCSGKWINDGVTAAVNLLRAPGIPTPSAKERTMTSRILGTDSGVTAVAYDDTASLEEARKNANARQVDDPMEHELKCWPQFWTAVDNGTKTFEIRRADRPFQVGDTLVLNEFDPNGRGYTGRVTRKIVSYITNWQQRDGYIVMGLAAQGITTPSEKERDLRLRLAERQIERMALCPDHRDKATGRCIVCQAEERTKEEVRAAQRSAATPAP